MVLLIAGEDDTTLTVESEEAQLLKPIPQQAVTIQESVVKSLVDVTLLP